MEFIFEIILELLFEGGKEICANQKISKWIRYPIAFILGLFCGVVIFGIMVFGIGILKENIFIGLLFIILFIVMLIAALIKFKKVYTQRERK